MNTSTTTVERVEAWLVPEHARIGTLPRHFGMHMLTVEGRIYVSVMLRPSGLMRSEH